MGNKGTLAEILKKADIFSSLDDSALEILQSNLKRAAFKPGDIICREGESGNSMFVLESGNIRVLKRGKDNIEVDITVLGPGEVAGIMSLFGDDRRSATLTAADEVVLWEMRDTEFQALLSAHPPISRALLQTLSGYLRENIRVVADLRSHDVDNRLKVGVFDSKPYTEKAFIIQNADRYALKFFDFRLSEDTASMAAGFRVICCFVNDTVDAAVVKKLKDNNVEMIAMRCAGYNNVDLDACRDQGISVANVPVYSPFAIAEHSVALMMALNRHVNRAYNRVRDGNYSLGGLVGFDMFGKTVGIIGAGRIGMCAVNILAGFGCTVLIHNRTPVRDPRPCVRDVTLDELLRESDIVSLHAPLVPETHHLIDDAATGKMKPGVMLINTGRGGLVDSQALIRGLLSGKIGSAGLDVYEEEEGYFFEDHSGAVLKDEVLARLTTFPNVIVTPHMAFLTQEALQNIADVTLGNIRAYEEGGRGSALPNSLVKFD
jgi:D-lactate dehydrogenase